MDGLLASVEEPCHGAVEGPWIVEVLDEPQEPHREMRGKPCLELLEDSCAQLQPCPDALEEPFPDVLDQPCPGVLEEPWLDVLEEQELCLDVLEQPRYE
jgi:hypothetical protein